MMLVYSTLLIITLLLIALRIYNRLLLSKAKHSSLRGHAKVSRVAARLLPFYEFDERQFFRCDGASDEVAAQRRSGFERLSTELRERSPHSIRFSESIAPGISDVQFTSNYRVPFQFRNLVRRNLAVGSVADAAEGTRIRDIDGNWFYDLFGSYGVNVFGYDFYRECMDAGIEHARALGPVLGPYHPVVADNVNRLLQISGMDEVSFHMSGTEAVMQAVRLARYHTRRPKLVLFCGAYHGWWDGVQPGVGNMRRTTDVYTLKEMSIDTLRVLRRRDDIACVLVNPLQAMHPNSGAPGDATLIGSERSANFDKQTYIEWLKALREVCDEKRIVLIFDEVFVGFRFARGGAQEFFGVRADMVTYGKTLGGGFPVGAVCGIRHLMKRFREDKPSDVCFARGTFNSHPYVMAAMNEFLRRIDEPAIRESYAGVEQLWNSRVTELNQRLEQRTLPLRLVNLVSVCTILYTRPSRYNWMLQYYLRAQGLHLSWVGSGRLIFSHNYSDQDFEEVMQRFIAGAEAMQTDGWWWQSKSLTSKSIKRQVLREMFTALAGELFGSVRRRIPVNQAPLSERASDQ